MRDRLRDAKTQDKTGCADGRTLQWNTTGTQPWVQLDEEVSRQLEGHGHSTSCQQD